MVKTNTYNGRYHFSSAQLTASENALSMWTSYVNDKTDNEKSAQNTKPQRRN
jgi:hypothetical protein